MEWTFIGRPPWTFSTSFWKMVEISSLQPLGNDANILAPVMTGDLSVTVGSPGYYDYYLSLLLGSDVCWHLACCSCLGAEGAGSRAWTAWAASARALDWGAPPSLTPTQTNRSVKNTSPPDIRSSRRRWPKFRAEIVIQRSRGWPSFERQKEVNREYDKGEGTHKICKTTGIFLLNLINLYWSWTLVSLSPPTKGERAAPRR